jgi:hypothetical protein
LLKVAGCEGADSAPTQTVRISPLLLALAALSLVGLCLVEHALGAPPCWIVKLLLNMAGGELFVEELHLHDLVVVVVQGLLICG